MKGDFVACILLSVCFLPVAQAEDGSILPDSKNQILKLGEQGVLPKELRMKLEDSILFLLNDSRDSLTTVQIAFGDKKTHCASSNMKIEDDGTIRSTRPFGPKDFASVCFHERGSYPVTVYGLKGNTQTGLVVVE